MGKVKKLRQKYHLSLKKSKSSTDLTENAETEKPGAGNLTQNPFKSSENIFAGLNISLSDLTKSLPDNFDVQSVISTKSRKELKEEEKHLKKKERMKLRRERFLNKLEFAYQTMNNKKSKKGKRKKSSNDANPLLDALPMLEELSSGESKKKKSKDKSKAKPQGILKAKQRHKQQFSDSKIFRKILENNKFKNDPFQTISEYLKQKVSSETS